MKRTFTRVLLAAAVVFVRSHADGAAQPIRYAHGMVVSQNAIASAVGRDVLVEGGTAVDAAVATAFVPPIVRRTATRPALPGSPASQK